VKNSLGMSMILIPPGEFMMGSPESELSLWDQHQDNELLHRVRLTRPYRMSIHLVRVRDFRAFVSAANYRTDVEKDPKGGWAVVDGVFKQDRHFNWRNPGFAQQEDFPVVFVSWNDATAFCKWLSTKEKIQYRLPTEAEWEYACRAGTTSPYYFGSSCNGTLANCDGKHPYGTTTKGPFVQRTCAAGSYVANAFGLFDMSGNAFEWCSDWYRGDFFANSRKEDPTGPLTGDARVVRGGGWASWAQSCRSANRGGADPNEGNVDCGFRMIAELEMTESDSS
jgi:formylglycine-generating enzyme required for sulfatase activity